MFTDHKYAGKQKNDKFEVQMTTKPVEIGFANGYLLVWYDKWFC